MMSLIYLLSKFSHEAMVLELFLISLLSLCLFSFYLFKRRRYGIAKNNISDQVVRAFLIELISMSEGFKQQLFGESLQIAAKGASSFATTTEAAKALAATMTASGGADIAALKAQLTAAIARQEELGRSVSQLSAEKTALEERLRKAAAAGSAAPAGDPAAVKALEEALKKISTLESKLSEYEVIEDDLANLKRYQQENKQLKATIEMLRKGGAEAPAAEPEPVAESKPADAIPSVMPEADIIATASPIADAEEMRTDSAATDGLDKLADKVEESLAPAAGASSVDTAAAAPAADDAPKSDKSDADLLSEFEKMLST